MSCSDTKITGMKQECHPGFNKIESVLFNPETKEVYIDKKLIGHGEYDQENKTLKITYL